MRKDKHVNAVRHVEEGVSAGMVGSVNLAHVAVVLFRQRKAYACLVQNRGQELSTVIHNQGQPHAQSVDGNDKASRHPQPALGLEARNSESHKDHQDSGYGADKR